MDKNYILKIKYLKIYGAEVFIHWATAPLLLFLSLPLSKSLLQFTFLSILFLLLIFLHEAGHAIFAKFLGHQSIEIVVKNIGGYFLYEMAVNNRRAKDEAIIAWGGVSAQLLFSLPIIALSIWTELLNNKIMIPVVYVFG